MSKKKPIFALEKQPPKVHVCPRNALQMCAVSLENEDNLLIIKKTNTMKKALLFIGLAMCSTLAFAQANNYAKTSKVKDANQTLSINLNEVALQNADYKASIFTKVAGDTLATYNFETNPSDAGILYAADGLVAAGDMVNGVALTQNGSTDPSARWQWIQDSNFISGQQFSQTYPNLSTRYSRHLNNFRYYLCDDGGFMLMSLTDVTTPDAGTTARTMQIPHAYIQFPAIPNNPAQNRVIDVAFNQIHIKFYDQSFIDYKIGNNWKTREINVDGVDADINSYSPLRCRFVMPIELAGESSINIRIRYLGGVRSNAYGYWWAIDNVNVIVGGTNRWTADAQDYAGGAYGTIPQGMDIPLSWWAPVYNAGANNITGAQLVASHISPDGTATQFATDDMPNLTAGDPTVPTAYYFNEQGLLYTDSLTNDFYYILSAPGAYGHSGHYMDSVMHSDLGYRGIPTSTLGRNRVAVSATADSNLSLNWDTIAYRVVGNTTTDEQNVEGYRWGHDNGIIRAGGTYQYGYTSDGRYITEEGNFDQNDYGVYVRYTTGATIPTDPNGDPWVLRGVEIVTSSEFQAAELNGTKLRPVTYVDVYDVDENTMYFYSLDNGVNNVTYTLNGNDIENYLEFGVNTAVADNYKGVNIFFPTQPALEPNTSYRVGYRLTATSTFGAANTGTTYRYAWGTNSDGQTVGVFQSYDSNATSAPWRHQFWPNNLDVLVSDPAGGNGLLISSFYYDSYPLIRAIVGPREQLPDASVNVICDDENAHYIEYNNEILCGQTLTIPETSGPTFTIVPAGDLMILDTLYIDGQPVTLSSYDDDGDDDFVAHDYSIYDTINWWGEFDSVFCNVRRAYWTYTFRDIHGNHSIAATSHEGEWIPSGVDPVAPEVRMHLAPNPATSQVVLDVRGVAGMVNCSIIDMSGRIVYERQVNAETTNTIDLRNVPAGAYFVRITNDTFSKVEKLIVR